MNLISTSVPKASKHTASIPSKIDGRSVTEAGVTVYLPVDLVLVLDLTILLRRVLNLQSLARLVQHIVQALADRRLLAILRTGIPLAPAVLHRSTATQSAPYPRRNSGGTFKAWVAKSGHPVENPDANLGFCFLIFEGTRL